MMIALTSSFLLGGFFGGWELMLIAAILLILVSARGLAAFAKALGQAFTDIDNASHDAGRSLGEIYGKPAAEALTPRNETAELYDPAVFRRDEGATGKRSFRRFRTLLRRIIHAIEKLVRFLFFRPLR